MSARRIQTTTPWRRDPAELEAGLGKWARAFYGDAALVTEVRPPENGMANDTVLLRINGEPLVARLAPLPGSPFPTFPACDLDMQRKVMRLVKERTRVPVPEVVHLEPSNHWLGVPFLLLRAVEGVVPPDNPPYVLDGWLLRASLSEQQRLVTSSIAVLAELHRLVDDGAWSAFLCPNVPGDTALDRQLGYQRAYYEWASEGEPVPWVDRAFEVISATMPATDRSVLNWGDSRIGNILYRDFEPVAVLDWEMATVGPPEVDVGWMTFFHTFFQGIAEEFGFPGLPDLFRRDDVAATYESLSGRLIDDLAWYEAFAALRYAIISIRTSLRSVVYGVQEPPARRDDLILFLPLFERALEAL